MKKVMVDLSKVSWGLLRSQKQWLLDHDDDDADGLVNLIYAIQDQAAKILGEEAVFGPE